jgi:hypothetical protein
VLSVLFELPGLRNSLLTDQAHVILERYRFGMKPFDGDLLDECSLAEHLEDLCRGFDFEEDQLAMQALTRRL